MRFQRDCKERESIISASGPRIIACYAMRCSCFTEPVYALCNDASDRLVMNDSKRLEANLRGRPADVGGCHVLPSLGRSY